MGNNHNDSGIHLNVDMNSIDHLSPETLSKVLENEKGKRESEGGVLGKFFGINPVNASFHIGFVIVFLLLLLFIGTIVCDYCFNKDVHTSLGLDIMPIVTLFLGYLFGKGRDNNP